ncbi:MAG: tetratricopeptide repeat protein [Candidatus Heimdallarchaeota archaeon]|nr:tetratricopeptide repeat protein [Candidatus Heimdallarchaeota archaeon]
MEDYYSHLIESQSKKTINFEDECIIKSRRLWRIYYRMKVKNIYKPSDKVYLDEYKTEDPFLKYFSQIVRVIFYMNKNKKLNSTQLIELQGLQQNNVNSYWKGLRDYYLAKYLITNKHVEEAKLIKELLHSAKLESESCNNQLLKGECIFLEGVFNFINNEFSQTITLYIQALKIFKENNYNPNYRSTLMSIAGFYARFNEFEKSIEYYQLAMDEAPDNLKHYMYVIFGDLYLKMGDYEQAMDYYELGRQIYLKSNDYYSLTSCLDGIGHILLINEEYVDAELCLLDSIEIKKREEITGSDLYINSYILLGKFYFAIGNTENALTHLKHAKKLALKRESIVILAEIKKILKSNQSKLHTILDF